MERRANTHRPTRTKALASLLRLLHPTWNVPVRTLAAGTNSRSLLSLPSRKPFVAAPLTSKPLYAQNNSCHHTRSYAYGSGVCQFRYIRLTTYSNKYIRTKYILSRRESMTFRQQRGKELAQTRTIRRDGRYWIVPSQRGLRFYKVDLWPKRRPTCTCPDFKQHRRNCKHIFAAYYTQLRDGNR